MNKYLSFNRLVFHTCLAATVLACGQKEKNEPKKVEEAVAPAAPEFKHELFPTAEAALASIIDRTKPKVVGFGEFHQQDHTVKTVSSLKRFTDELLPAISKKTANLIVETWVSEGNCGETEKKVVAEVEAVSKRPAHTENETITLLKTAKAMDITPHILEMACDDYDKVQGDAGVDYLAMLELVKTHLENKGRKILGKETTKKSDRNMLAIYCGAIHNDAKPEEMWESVSIGPELIKWSGNKYIEIDLYVPEFIENSDIAKAEPWFPTFERTVSSEKAVVIQRAKNAFIIIYKKGVEATPASP